MTELLIWSNYLAASALTLWRAKHIELHRLSFSDGLLIGSIYYLILPMFFVLIDGKLSAQFVMSNDYFPYKDLDTTLTILICLYFIPILHFLLPRPAPTSSDTDSSLHFERTLIAFVIFAYFVSTMGSFWLSGLWAGGHWYNNVHQALTTNGLALALRHIAGFARTAVFAVLLYGVVRKIVSLRVFYALGTAVVICDLFMTFNRITAVYFLIAILLLNRNRHALVGGLLVGLIFVLPALSNMWPMFRSLATRDGYTLDGMLAAIEVAFRAATAHQGMADFTSGVFESVNIPVLNYVVQNQSQALNVDIGSIYVRPATIFLPTMIWSDRPPVFGTILGSTINNSTTGLGLNSTLIGEPYGSFGAWWPIGILPMYTLYHLLFMKLSKSSGTFGAIGAFAALAMWRFDSTTAAISLVLCVVFLWAVRTWLSLRATNPVPGRVGT